MWCSTCQQDVPAVVQPVVGKTVCARCQHPLNAPQPAHAVGISDAGIALDDSQPATAPPAPASRLDDWHSQRQVRNLGRTLRRAGVGSLPTAASSPSAHRRFDPPQDLLEGIQLHAASESAAAGPISPITTSTVRRTEGGQVTAWLVVVAGTLLLAAGLGTIGWSLTAERTDFWNLAIGLTLGGQGTLIFGLVLVVLRLWRNSRYAAGRLHDVHARLGQLQRTTDAMAAMRGGAPAFYAELVRGASPQMLLSNLKGQLDQLATRVGGGV
jgi:hypothetical protein